MHAEGRQLKIRLPVKVKEWLETEAAANHRTQSAEIAFVLEERMKEKPAERMNP